MKFSKRMEFAIELSAKCEQLLKDISKKRINLNREQKGVNDFVTAADKAIEEFIFKSIREYFPNDSILSEEGSNFEKGGIQWIIDPLDGTTNFYFGYPAYCISVAYKDEKGVQGGVIRQPLLNEVFNAEKGMGAFLNNQSINVNQFREPSENLIVMGFANRKHEYWDDYAKTYTNVMPKVIDIRRTGSAALDLCYVACGRFGAYYEPAVKVWDIAAGSLVVIEAGGNITDRNGKAINFCEEDYSILATNGLLHDWFLNNTKQE